MLTDGSELRPATRAEPASTPPSTPQRGPRTAPVNVLPSGPTITLRASEKSLSNAFLGHTEGQPLTFPSEALIRRYSKSSTDMISLEEGNLHADSKIYARLIAIYLVEKHGGALKIQINSPKGDTYGGATYLRRDLSPTMLRIANGESIAKSLNNAAYNNDGCQTSNRVKYDRYGKNFKGNRPNSTHLPAPSTSANYWEFYVDRDNAKGASPLSIGDGRPGAERLFFGAPDYVYYTWNHYGSDVRFGPDRSNLAEADIWSVYSMSQGKWMRGLTR